MKGVKLLYFLCGFSILYSDVWGVTFSKTFGGTNIDMCLAIQTSDGGYLLSGYTNSFGAGGYDILLIKLSHDGTLQWAKTFGGTNDDYVHDFAFQTEDGGFIVAGHTRSFGAGGYDIIILKVSSTGNLQWAKTFGGGSDEWPYSIMRTSDGGFVVGGLTYSFGAGYMDAIILKLSSTGSLEWIKTFGGVEDDYIHMVIQTADGGFLGFGTTWSFGAGERDIFLLKLSPTGNLEWMRTYGGWIYDLSGGSFQQTSDGGFIVAGSTGSFGAGLTD